MLSLLFVPFALLAYDASVAEIIEAAPSKVRVAAEAVLSGMNLGLEIHEPGRIETGTIQTELSVLAPYIAADAEVEQHGWTAARARVAVLFDDVGAGMTRVAVSAELERFGVADARLLIPPAWARARSNGRLETAIIAAIRAYPLPRPGGVGQLPPGFPEGRMTQQGLDDPPFIPNVPVSNDPGTGNQNETTIGVFGRDFICGGWNDNRTGVYHVGFSRSTDAGLSWYDDTLMFEPTYPEDGDPVICIDDAGTIYYFWLSFNRSNNSGDVFLTKSSDGGATWGPSLNCTPGTPSSLDDKPWAAIDGDNVFLTWYEYGASNALKLKRSTDRGATWSAGVTVGSGGNGTYPFRGTDSTLYVGWGMQDVRLNISTNMGATWQGQRTIIPVTWSPGTTPWRTNNIPSFGTSRDRTTLYVVFACSRLRTSQLDVFFSRSTDAGQSWSTPVKLNDTSSGDTTKQLYPWLAVDPYDRIHVVWHDTREGGGRLAQYYSRSTDLGLTWSANERVSDTAVYSSTFIGDYTASAADSFRVHALWCDTRRGQANPDIFYSHALLPEARDVAATAIVAPTGQVDSGDVVMPRALIRNYGAREETLLVRLTIGALYRDSVLLSIAAGAEDTARFADWTALPVGTHAVRCTTMLAGDFNPDNDLAVDSVNVMPGSGAAGPSQEDGLPVFTVAPNPFRSRAVISLRPAAGQRAGVRVYSASGRLVRELAAVAVSGGIERLMWDGRDAGGRAVPAGVYYCRLKSSADTRVLPVVLAR